MLLEKFVIRIIISILSCNRQFFYIIIISNSSSSSSNSDSSGSSSTPRPILSG